MSTNDTSSFFTTHQTRDVPRDQWGRYKLPGPDGSEKSWTRATTLAATIAEQYALRIWEQRMVVWGLSRRPDLLTMASTISGPEDKKALGEIVDEAHIAAGTKAKANRGTSIHRACQAAERGAFHEVPEELRSHVAKYFAAMRSGGLEILPEFVERTVIVSAYDTAGTFDNLVRCPDGKIRVADKKTGRMDYSDVEFAVQMSLYANADAMFNYDTGRYEPLPEIAKDYAILAHIDPETGDCELQRINIEWGWVWAKTCAEVMAIRKTKHIITPYIRPEGALDGMDSRAMTPAQESRQPLPVVETVFGRPLGPTDSVSRDVDGTFRVNGQPVGPPPEQPDPHYGGAAGPPPHQNFAMFWAQPFDSDDEPAAVNGVPLEQYGAASKQWGCFSGQPCEFTGDEGLHSDGTVCLYGNARPGPIPPMPPAPVTPEIVNMAMGGYEITGQTGVTTEELPIGVNRNPGHIPPEANPDSGEPRQPDGEIVDPGTLVAAIDGLKGGKAAVQSVARRLMQKLGIAEGAPDAIKLQQYKIKIARAVVDLAHARGVSIPGQKDGAPDFGVPSGPVGAEHTTANSAGAPAPRKAKGDAGAAEVASAQAADPTREEKLRVAVESIMMQTTIAGLQERHAYYSATSLGWTEEMQSAARTRAAAIEQESGQTPLSPLEMIQGATSRETLTKAWEKATDGGTHAAGWTEEMQTVANAKAAELSGVATSNNQ